MLYSEVRNTLGKVSNLQGYYTANSSTSLNIEPVTTLTTLSNPYSRIIDRQRAIIDSYRMMHKGAMPRSRVAAAPGVFPYAHEQVRDATANGQGLLSADDISKLVNMMWNGVPGLQGGRDVSRMGLADNVNYVGLDYLAADGLGLGRFGRPLNSLDGNLSFTGVYDRKAISAPSEIQQTSEESKVDFNGKPLSTYSINENALVANKTRILANVLMGSPPLSLNSFTGSIEGDPVDEAERQASLNNTGSESSGSAFHSMK